MGHHQNSPKFPCNSLRQNYKPPRARSNLHWRGRIWHYYVAGQNHQLPPPTGRQAHPEPPCSRNPGDERDSSRTTRHTPARSRGEKTARQGMAQVAKPLTVTAAPTGQRKKFNGANREGAKISSRPHHVRCYPYAPRFPPCNPHRQPGRRRIPPRRSRGQNPGNSSLNALPMGRRWRVPRAGSAWASRDRIREIHRPGLDRVQTQRPRVSVLTEQTEKITPPIFDENDFSSNIGAWF